MGFAAYLKYIRKFEMGRSVQIMAKQETTMISNALQSSGVLHKRKHDCSRSLLLW